LTPVLEKGEIREIETSTKRRKWQLFSGPAVPVAHAMCIDVYPMLGSATSGSTPLFKRAANSSSSPSSTLKKHQNCYFTERRRREGRERRGVFVTAKEELFSCVSHWFNSTVSSTEMCAKVDMCAVFFLFSSFIFQKLKGFRTTHHHNQSNMHPAYI